MPCRPSRRGLKEGIQLTGINSLETPGLLHSGHAWKGHPAPHPLHSLPNEEKAMSRVAIVTGGTRGLGRAIAIALKKDGHRVIAVYRGNHDAAEAFHRNTDIPVYSWD